ncbi:unnamed protein product [Camellia sinensis]
MATFQTKALLYLKNRTLFVGSTLVSFLLFSALWSFTNHFANSQRRPSATAHGSVTPTDDPPDPTFYDDPSLSYSFGSPVLIHHPSFAAAGAPVRVVIVTGSRPPQCENPIRDHLLLRLFKNKVDYCRIHGHDIFYNNAFLHRKMQSVWAKLPPVRVAIVAHPEAEWIWWLDSDAVLTDMDFKLPFEKYRDLNFIINGWDGMSCSTRRKAGWV